MSQDRDEAFREAKEAARAGNALKMVEALYKSYFIDGMKRRLQQKWPSIPNNDIDSVIAEAIDTLYFDIRNGKRVYNIAPYLWKIADRKAYDVNSLREQEVCTEDAELERIANKGAQECDPADAFSETGSDELSEELESERKRLVAIGVARKLIDRLGQQNCQAVLAYILDALEAGQQDVSNEEISEALGLTPDTVRTSKSRGFRRLQRICAEEGVPELNLEELGLED